SKSVTASSLRSTCGSPRTERRTISPARYLVSFLDTSSMDLLSLRKRREKFSDQGGQRTGLLDARNVAGIPDDLKARAGNEFGQPADQVRRRRAVLVADDAKRGHGNCL